MSFLGKSSESNSQSKVLKEINKVQLQNRQPQKSFNKAETYFKIHFLKNNKKHKTLQPSQLQNLKKVNKFAKFIHSNVPQQVRKYFIIDLYKDVKYSVKSLKGPKQQLIDNKKVKLNQIQKSTKKFLFLDIDQTLIYTQRVYYSNVITNQIKYSFDMQVRPYAKQFLDNISKYYDVYIFTAATKQYARQVVDFFNAGKKIIQDYLCRDHCLQTKNGKFIKDLRIVQNRNLKDMIIVDNKAYSFGLQLDNGIPILEFSGSKNDQQLKHLQKLLIEFSDVQDVRENISKHYNLKSLVDLSKEELHEILNCGNSLGHSTKYLLRI